MKILHRANTLIISFVALIAIASMVSACAGVEYSRGLESTTAVRASSPFDPTPPKTTGPLVAYRAADEIGLVDGTKVIVKVRGTFDASNDLITTDDGRFVFARTTDNKIAVIDVDSGKGATRDVQAGPVLGTIGESTIAWLEQPNRLMQLDLANKDSEPVLYQAIDLPPVSGVRAEPRLLVARGGTAVIARLEAPPSPFGGPDTLYAVRGPGPPTRLGQADANSPVMVARLSPDGAELAYALYRASDGGCGTAAVVLSDADGQQQTFDVAGPGADAGSKVPKLWWPVTGPPELSLATWRCDRPESNAPLVWQLADDRIEQITPPTSALQTAEVAPGQRAMILPETGGSAEPTGTLVLEESGRRIPIKDEVDAIAVLRRSP